MDTYTRFSPHPSHHVHVHGPAGSYSPQHAATTAPTGNGGSPHTNANMQNHSSGLHQAQHQPYYTNHHHQYATMAAVGAGTGPPAYYAIPGTESMAMQVGGGAGPKGSPRINPAAVKVKREGTQQRSPQMATAVASHGGQNQSSGMPSTNQQTAAMPGTPHMPAAARRMSQQQGPSGSPAIQHAQPVNNPRTSAPPQPTTPQQQAPPPAQQPPQPPQQPLQHTPVQPHQQSPDIVPAEETPLYVNAKQFHRILKRRVARQKLEEALRLTSKQRKPYLHESRHNHAMRRPRGPGGRFLTADEVQAMTEREKRGSGGIVGDVGGMPDGVKEIEKPNNATRTPNNKGTQQQQRMATGNPPSSGSLKRKATQAGLPQSSPLKKSKPGNGRVRMPTEIDDELGLDE